MNISVIIPIYNALNYISRCLDSIASQTIKDFEVIFVDDCGTDGTIEKVQNYINAYTGSIHFKIIHHQVNRGAAAARNSGLKAAEGYYIIFIDCDDTITSDCLENLSSELDNNTSLELVIGGMTSIPYREYYDLNLYKERKVFNGNVWARYECDKYGQAFPVSPCNKMFRKSFLLDNNIWFYEGIVHEDELWVFSFTRKLSSVCFTGKTTYLRYVNPNSVMTSMSTEKSAQTWLVILNEMLDYKEKITSNLLLLKCQSIFTRYVDCLYADRTYRQLCTRLVLKLLHIGKFKLAVSSWITVFLYPIHHGRYFLRRVINYSRELWRIETESFRLLNEFD